jgi:phage baseplate assembly protein W
MNRDTGRAMDTAAHLRQSIADILTTPIGSRVMRRDYGSVLPELIDQPFNDVTRLRAYAAIAVALMRWETRLQLTRVALSLGERPGAAVLDIEGTQADRGGLVSLQVPLQMGALA